MIKNLIFIFCIMFAAVSYGLDAKEGSLAVKFKEGSLTMRDLLGACKEISIATPSTIVNPSIPGKIITIKGHKYEIRFFSFEDTKNVLPKNITFKEYAKKNKLLKMKSIHMKPQPNIHFESFDFHRAHLDDGVYFSMAVRLMEK